MSQKKKDMKEKTKPDDKQLIPQGHRTSITQLRKSVSRAREDTQKDKKTGFQRLIKVVKTMKTFTLLFFTGRVQGVGFRYHTYEAGAVTGSHRKR